LCLTSYPQVVYAVIQMAILQVRPGLDEVMVEKLMRWINETGAALFKIPNLRGDIVLNFDTAIGSVRPVVHLSGGAAPPTTT
jgi:hypothetical protein